MTLHGIDVSHWQDGLDLAATDAQFVIIKATEGNSYVDPMCDTFYSQAAGLGLPRGVYHFYRGGGAAEADWFLSNTRGYIGDGLLALDFEDHTDDVKGAKAFLDRVYSATGVRPVIYMSTSVLNANDWSSVQGADYGLWLARWASSPGDVSPWSGPTLWQHTDAYSTGGMAVDGDYFYGDAEAWAAYARGGGGTDMTRSRDEGASWAKGKVGTTGYGGMCLQFTREAYAIGSLYGYAREAWDKAKHKHPTSSTSGIPYGVPIFLDKSSSEYGHVAVYVGDGYMISTHASTNKIGKDAVSTWVNDYGYKVLGWTEDLNGVLIPNDDDHTDSGGSGGSDVKVPDVSVDGIWGSGTTKQRQALLTNSGHYGGAIDGTIDHQNPAWQEDNPGLGSGWGWDHDYKGKGGSSTVKADQTRLSKIKGSDGKPLYRGSIDGLAGPDYFSAIQREQKTTVDGEVSRPSKMVKAIQSDGNAGRLS